MADEFTNESFCTVIFDEFFLAGMTKDSVTRHLLKLLWWVHPKLPIARLYTLVKSLEPNSQVIVSNFLNCFQYFIKNMNNELFL
jgi:negative elongation factor B